MHDLFAKPVPDETELWIKTVSIMRMTKDAHVIIPNHKLLGIFLDSERRLDELRVFGFIGYVKICKLQ